MRGVALRLKKMKDLLKTKSNKKDSKEVVKNNFSLPIKDIIDETIIGENKTFKCVIKVSPINGELCTHEQLIEISNSIQGALSSFEGRQGIYILSEKVDIKENIKNIEQKILQLDEEFKIKNLEQQKEDLQALASKSRTVLNFYLVLETKKKNLNIANSILDDSYGSVKSELEGSDLYCERLNKDQIKELLYLKMNPDSSLIEKYKEDWNLENIYPENAVRFEDGRHLEIENRIYRFFSITKFPKYVEEFRWLRKLLNIKGDVNIAITLTPKNKMEIQNSLSKAVTEIGAKERGAKDVALRESYKQQKDSAIKIIQNLGNDNTALFDTNITIGISARTMEELETLANLVRSKISSSYLQSTELKRKDFDPFYTILPILPENKITRDYTWNLTTKDISSIVPFDSSEFMETTGILVGENITSRGLVIANYRNKIYNNAHTCIIADSGSGKTFFIKTDAIRHVPYVDYTIVFDVKGDLIFPFGKRYSFSAISNIVVNPFHIRNATIDTEDQSANGKNNVGLFLTQKIMDLIVFFKWIIPNMTPYDESLLEEDIRDCYKRVGLDFSSTELPEEFCTLQTLEEIQEEKIKDTDLQMERERRQFIKSCLRPYTKGAYSKMFNGQTNWEFDYFTTFDISNIPEAIQKPLYDILLKDTWQFSKKDGAINPTSKNIYVDECHIFSDPENPQTLKFLSTQLSKQGRGFGIRLTTATQNLPDFLSIPRYGQAIIDNSYFKLFMRLGDSDIPVAQKLFKFSKKEMEVISGKGSNKKGSKGKGVYMVGSQRILVQSRASKHELEMIDPKQYESIYKEKSRYF